MNKNQDSTAFKRSWLEEHDFFVARVPHGFCVTGNIDAVYDCYFERETEEEVIDFAFEQIFDDFCEGDERL